MDPEVLRKLHEQDWNELGRRLVAHAIRRARIRGWREWWRDAVVRLGTSPEDIVHDVIQKVFAGQRTWDPAKGELLPTLKRMVESDLNHLWEKQAGDVERPFPEDPGAREPMEASAAALPGAAFTPAVPVDPEEAMERQDEVVAASARVTALFAAVAGEADLQELIDAIMEGCPTEPRHLAEHLKVPVSEIHNRLRRLRRRATE